MKKERHIYLLDPTRGFGKELKIRKALYLNDDNLDACSYALSPLRKMILKGINAKQCLIDKVIFNEPATIVIWANGDKTVVRCQPGDTFDKEKGLTLAITKYFFGNKSKYNEVIKKYTENGEK